MNKTKILAALAIPALFAACSQEEFAESTKANVDLSSRKVIENVVLSFGEGAETRAGIGTSSWNSYAWTTEDGVGACLIDDNDGNITDYISTNYKYYFTDANQWKTDALMVEGQYMFYAPYNGNHLTRENIVATLPTTQNVKVQNEDNNAIAEFYASGAPVFVGFKALEAEGQEKVINVAMRHIFAYPLFKLVNKYDLRTQAEIDAHVAPKYQDITIVKVELSDKSGAKIGAAFDANNTNVEAKLKTVSGSIVWDADKHESAATSNIFDVKRDEDGNNIEVSKVTINFGEGITLKGNESLSFHAVLPAEAYGSGINVVAYDKDGNTYTISSADVRTGLTLNPGYRYPAQEYNTDGTLKDSKGTLLTYELTTQNAAPTDITNNDDFIAYLRSLSVRYNTLAQVDRLADISNESEFKLNENAYITINTALIDALDNYNYVAGVNGTVAFKTVTGEHQKFAIDKNVKIASATFDTNKVTLNVESANGKQYTVVLPASDRMAAAAGTYVISTGALRVDAAQAAPTNIIVTGAVSYAGGNAKKITSLNVCGAGALTLTGTVEDVQINNGADVTISAGALVTSKIVNNRNISNSGTIYGESNVNNGTITAAARTAVTKVAYGEGTIVNTNLSAVKANAGQTVTWTGSVSDIKGDNGLAKKGEAKYGINYVVITDSDLDANTITLAQLKAPIKNCAVATVELSYATKLTLKEGGDMSAITLVFDQSCEWVGDAFNAPEFTNAKIAVAAGKTVKVSYASVSGTQLKPTGYEGKIEKKDSTGSVNF